MKIGRSTEGGIDGSADWRVIKKVIRRVMIAIRNEKAANRALRMCWIVENLINVMMVKDLLVLKQIKTWIYASVLSGC